MAAPGSSCRDDPESPIRERPLAVPSDDLRLLVVYDRDARENHAVTVIRFEQRWPNRTNDIKDDAKATNLRPLFILGDPWARRATAGPKPQPVKDKDQVSCFSMSDLPESLSTDLG
jgi:hypothetical protein